MPQISGNCRRLAALAAMAGLLSLSPANASARGDQKWEKMDYGRFLTATIHADAPRDNDAMKGIAIKLGKEGEAAVCFDTDLLRMSAGWTGGFLKLQGTPFDGSHGSWPGVDGKQIFGTIPGPGWAKGDDFKDPRPEPFGPLPADRAKFKGLYLSGDDVVLKYTVGATEVLEKPGLVEKDGVKAITRTFNVGPTAESLSLLVAEMDGARGGSGAPETSAIAAAEGPTDDGWIAVTGVGADQTTMGVIGAPEGSAWHAVKGGGRIELRLPASSKPFAFQVVLAKFPQAKWARIVGFLEKPADGFDLSGLLKGGPAHWTKDVETKGELGKGDGPYAVDTITAPEDNPYDAWMRFGGLDFFSDGRAALSTWSGDVWIVSGIDEKLETLKWKRFATGLYQPLGLKIVDDQVYTLGRDGITRLLDLNGDGEADFFDAFNHDMAVTTGFHEFAFDLQTDPLGNFYFAKAGPVKGGGRGFDTIAANSGCVMKVSKDGKTLENYATGFRAPNGIGVGPNGEVTSGDNEGTWTPKCRLNWIKPGGFYGVVDLAHRDEKPTRYDDPICWFPKEIDNSSGGQCWVDSDRWGPFNGRLLHTSYGTSSLYLVMMEKVGETVQGGVTKFPLAFNTGIMRPKFLSRDGQLYVAGLRGWQSNAARDAGFQRVRRTDKPVNMPTALHVIKGGIELTFTDPLDRSIAADAENYAIEQWNYLWCSEYGSDDYSARTPNYQSKVGKLNKLREDPGKNGAEIDAIARDLKKGRDPVEVKSAKVSEDGKTVTLEIPGLKPVMQMKIRGKLKAADGTPIPLEIHNTINAVPKTP